MRNLFKLNYPTYLPGGGKTGVVGNCGVAEVGGCIVGCADCSSIRMSPSLLLGPMATGGGEGRAGGARDAGVGPVTLGPGGTNEGLVYIAACGYFTITPSIQNITSLLQILFSE